MSNFNLLNSPWQEIFEAFSKGSTAFQLFGATVGIIFFILLISRPILRYLKENDILAITSKIVSLSEGAVVDPDTIKKKELVKQQADFYLV